MVFLGVGTGRKTAPHVEITDLDLQWFCSIPYISLLYAQFLATNASIWTTSLVSKLCPGATTWSTLFRLVTMHLLPDPTARLKPTKTNTGAAGLCLDSLVAWPRTLLTMSPTGVLMSMSTTRIAPSFVPSSLKRWARRWRPRLTCHRHASEIRFPVRVYVPYAYGCLLYKQQLVFESVLGNF